MFPVFFIRSDYEMCSWEFGFAGVSGDKTIGAGARSRASTYSQYALLARIPDLGVRINKSFSNREKLGFVHGSMLPVIAFVSSKSSALAPSLSAPGRKLG
jgi:hypothetical protein